MELQDAPDVETGSPLKGIEQGSAFSEGELDFPMLLNQDRVDEILAQRERRILEFSASRPTLQAPRRLPCPIWKAETEQNLDHTCNGLQAKTMSEVRRHLIRPHRGGEPHLPFLKLCPTCKEEILDPEEFLAHGSYGERCSNPQIQRRGPDASLEQWEALYRTISARMGVTLSVTCKCEAILS
jgi:hypothetical protein